jgi:hypothetical protein
MKMFFSVFFGSFFAIMAAASALYFISEYQNAEGAKQLLRDTTTAAKRLNSVYGTQSANLADAARNESEIELRNEVTLTKTVNIKTADGTFTIPSGTTVRTVHEKAEPGSIHINYEGYTFSIPLNVVAAGSQ